MRTISAAGLALAVLAATPAAGLARSFEDQVLAEINQARAHPARYARDLLREPAAYRHDDGGAYDDPAAVEEAVDFLQRQPPLPPLAAHPQLAAAASDHVAVQARRGGVGHGAPGALGRRLQSHGVWAGLAAEAISYGQPSPRDVVRQLVVDAGVPGRGHRRDIFGRAFQAAGVACGPHPTYGDMCVIEFAGAFVQR